MTSNPIILYSMITSLKEEIKSNKIDVNSPYALVAKTMELLEKFEYLSGEEKKRYVIIILEELAKGEDGIINTVDDLIPEKTQNRLKLILLQNMVEDVIRLVCDASKGKININKTVTVVKQNCTLFRLFCCN